MKLKMKELYINETSMSKKEYDIFIKADDKKFGFREDLYTIIYISLFIVCVILLFKNKIYILALSMLIILLVFLFARMIYPQKLVEKKLKSDEIKKQQKNKYIFYKYYFDVKNVKGSDRIFYHQVDKVLESDTHFYIYLTKRRAFALSKQGFIKGNVEEFAAFLKRRILFRYKKV